MGEPQIFMPELFREDEEGRVRLVAGYCPESKNWTFPRYLADPVSFTDNIEEKLLSPTGVLHSFTVVRRSMPEYEVPYVLALVDFPETVRVMAQVETKDFDALTFGEEMAVTTGIIRKAADGSDVVSYKFIPVREMK
ncbi:MAG: OB-fold domain-containing protein [Candidatus Dadabacteria bacterium]|nr:OB-fold domain-containing protein [Candidatus Dadabacteria bacterium]